MLEWHEHPRHTNEGPAIYFATCMRAPETWTDRWNADPWVDQLLLSDTVLSIKVPLSLVPLIMFRFY